MDKAQFIVDTTDGKRHLCHKHWVQSGGETIGDIPPDSGIVCEECSADRINS